MKRILITAIALAVFLAGVAAADRLIPTKGSLFRIEGTSTLHDWKMEGTTINGTIAAPPLEQWKDNASDVSVAIPVTSIKSEHEIRPDHHARARLQHPRIAGVDSAPGSGTTVRFTMPLAAAGTA